MGDASNVILQDLGRTWPIPLSQGAHFLHKRIENDDQTIWRQIVEDVAWLDDVKLKRSENITLTFDVM